MARIDYDVLNEYREDWKEIKMPGWKKNCLISLSKKLEEKARNNNDDIEGIELHYPEDCNDYEMFSQFASVFDAYVSPRNEGGYKIYGWGLNKEVNVE